MSGDTSTSRDRTRLCPTCRMEISVLATKCRYCGENVGRPRDEARQLTVKDLGGESVKHYVPPSSVMEALEAFRAEEEVAAAPADEGAGKRSYFGFGKKKAEAQQAKNTFDDLPDLDARSQDLASVAGPAPAPARGRVVRPPAAADPSWVKKVGVFAGLVAAIVILYLGGGSIWAYFTRPDDGVAGPKFVNPAKAMIEQGRPACEILDAAAEAELREPIPENRDITEIARQRVVDEIRALLNAPEWTIENVTKASAIAQKAYKADTGPLISDIKKEVDKESAVCRMTWVRSDPAGGTVTLGIRDALTDPIREVTFKKGELINDRFELTAVSRENIEVIDRGRNNRRLRYISTTVDPTVIR